MIDRNLHLIFLPVMMAVTSPLLAEEPPTDEGSDRTAPLGEPAQNLMEQGKVIKIIQSKDFLKAERLEFGMYAGGVTNDPFLRRWLGGVSATYHLNDLVAIELAQSFSPDLGAADNRQLTNEIKTTYAASPTISKVGPQGSVDLMFSPLYGKIAFNRANIVNFDIFFVAGGGYSSTTDTLESTGEEAPLTTQEADALQEAHFTTNFGFGFRGAFNDRMAVRIDGRSYQYIEHSVEHVATNPDESLEMKSNFVAQVGLSFFLSTPWKK